MFFFSDKKKLKKIKKIKIKKISDNCQKYNFLNQQIQIRIA